MKITLRTIEDTVLRFVRPLRARLDNATGRGVVKSLDDATKLARGQVAGTQVADDIEFVGPPGLSYRPLSGAEAITWAIGAAADHVIGMIFDRRMRLTSLLAEGEVALHIGVEGQRVHLLRDGSIEVRTGDSVGASVVLKPNGDVVVTPGAGAKVLLGDQAATKQVALGPTVQSRLDILKTAINGWVPVPNDGGAALKTALTTWLGGSNVVNSTNTYAKG